MMACPPTRRLRHMAWHRRGDPAALDGRGQWGTGPALTARPPSGDDHGTGPTGLAGRYRLRSAFFSRNNNGPLQSADGTTAASPRLRCPASRGCHRHDRPEPDAADRTPEIRPLPAGRRITDRGWGHLALHPPSAPTPHAPVGRVERRPFRHRPAPQHAPMLQPEVPVQPGAMGCVLLHDEERFGPVRNLARRRLRRHREIALGPVAAERRVRHDSATIPEWAQAV